MAETKRLYYEDAYLTEFEAEVVERTAQEGRPAVVLDRTAFYPESGGQPWDKGTLDGVPRRDEILRYTQDDQPTVEHHSESF